jgi:Ca2+/Na+ antiporter
MAEARQGPNVPGWVAWFTTRETTRASLRREAWFDVLAAIALSGSATVAAYFGWINWALALFPLAWLVVGVWKFASASWLDRCQAWDRIAAQPERVSRVAGTLWLVLGLALLALGVWRFWACFLSPDSDLLGTTLFMPFAQESLQLAQENAAEIDAFSSRGAAPHEYEEAFRRFQVASEELHRRQEDELRAAAPRFRVFEFVAASIAGLVGVLLCWSGYTEFRQSHRPGPDSVNAAQSSG